MFNHHVAGAGAVSRELFDGLLNGVALCRLVRHAGRVSDLVFVSVNEAFLAQTRLSGVREKTASAVIEGFADADADFLQLLGDVEASGEAIRCERYIVSLDMWLAISAYRPCAEHVVLIFDVITERKQAVEALVKSRAQLVRVIEGSDQGFWDWDMLTGRVNVSRRFETILGFGPGEMDFSRGAWDAIVHPDDLVRTRQAVERHVRGEVPVHEVEMRCRTKNQEWLWIQVRGRVVEWAADGSPLIMSGTIADIAERKKAELALRQAATVFENTQEGVMITDTEVNILSVNRAFAHITGYSLADVQGRKPSVLGSGRHDMAFYQEMWRAIDASGHWQGEICNRRRNGELYPQLTTVNAVTDEQGRITHYVGVFTDVSAIKASEENVQFMAQHDLLTRLPNRQLLFARLERVMESARQESWQDSWQGSGQLALLMVDLDRFKDINDSFGHLSGDHLLQQIADALRAHLRNAAILARLGGDEFAVVLDDLASPDDAGRAAEEVLDVLSGRWSLPNGVDVHLSASIGIALFPGVATSPEELLQQADAAMYRAKKEGRGRYQYFSEEMTRNARSRVELEGRLRHAIENGELQVHFQPQLNISTGLVVGAEALVRWHVPGNGVVGPDSFIPVAEETGLIHALGRFVLRETCRFGKAWLDRGLAPLMLAVNVSAVQLRDPSFGSEVLAVLDETGFPPQLLEIELTESSLMDAYDVVLPQLQILREHDIRVAIDDFGTGYSSLAYLKRFPLDVLKIDRSFVEHIGQRRDDREIVTAIIQMGHTLGFRVVAEGVESDEQLAYLKEKGCDVYQGFLCSRPMPGEAFEALLRR